jgi:hypothetical protein
VPARCSQFSLVQFEIFKLLTLDSSTHFDKTSLMESLDIERNTKSTIYTIYISLLGVCHGIVG